MKLSKNIIKEEKSKNKYTDIITPWQTMSPPQDTGLDLYIQPYIEEDSGDAFVLENIYGVQLKSTDNSKNKTSTGLKIQITKEHIQQWKNFKFPVKIVMYYIPDNSFYYLWIDKTTLTESTKNPTLHLNNLIDEVTYKKDTLKHIDKPSIIHTKYIHPDKNTPGHGEVIIKGRGNYHNFEDLKEELIEKPLLRLSYIHGINESKKQLFNDIKNHNLRKTLIVLYLLTDQITEAISELIIITNDTNCPESTELIELLKTYPLSKKDIELQNHIQWKNIFHKSKPISLTVNFEGNKISNDEHINQIILPFSIDPNKLSFDLPIQDIPTKTSLINDYMSITYNETLKINNIIFNSFYLKKITFKAN